MTVVVQEHLDDVAAASVVLWDAGRDLFADSVSNVESEPDGACARRVRRENGATRWIVEHGHPLVVSSLAKDPFSANKMLNDAGFAAYAGVPLMAAGDARGVLYAMTSRPHDFTFAELSFLRVVASLGARFLEDTNGLIDVDPAAYRSDDAMTVLIADDDEHLRQTLEMIIAGAGDVDVLTAATGSQTVRLALEHEPDLLLLDVGLGADDGFNVARQLREAGLSRRTQMWFVTGRRDRVDEEQREEVGAAGFLLKPFGRQQILSILDNVRAARDGGPGPADDSQPT